MNQLAARTAVLDARFTSLERTVSLATSCSREAARRARSAWHHSEKLFKTMSLDAALTAALARMILQRPAVEPLLGSATADDLVAAASGDDWFAVRALLSRSTIDEIMLTVFERGQPS